MENSHKPNVGRRDVIVGAASLLALGAMTTAFGAVDPRSCELGANPYDYLVFRPKMAYNGPRDPAQLGDRVSSRAGSSRC